MAAIQALPSIDWRPLHELAYRFTTGWEVAETVRTMQHTAHNFRLVVVRELADTPDLFGPYTYWVVATNLPSEGPHAKTSEEVIWHHQGRGNCERYIEDTKLRRDAALCALWAIGRECDVLFYTIGILALNLIKLMQLLVVPAAWAPRTLRSLRRGLFRFVAKVVSTGRQWFLQINKTATEIQQFCRMREKIGTGVPLA